MKHLSRRVVTSLCLGLFVGVQLFSALVAPHITAAATVYDRSADPAEHVKAYAYYFAMVRCAGDFKEYIPISQAGDVPNWLSPADRDVAVGYLIAPDDGRKECQHLFDAGIKMLGFASKQEFLKALGYKDYTCPASGNSDCTPNGKYLHLSGYSSDTRDTNIRNNMRDVLKKQAYNGESPVMRPYMEYVMYNATLKAACGLKFVQMASKGAPVKADGTAASGVHFAAVTQEGGRYGITDTYYSYDASDIGNSSGEKALYEASTGNKTISLDCGQMMLKMGADPKADPLKNPLALAYADYLNKLAVKDISKTVCGEAPAGEAAQSAYQACKAAVAKAFAECQESRMGAQATTLTTNAQVAACMLPKLQQYSPNLTQDSLAAALDGAAADIFDANASAVDVPGEDNVCGYQDGSALNWIACPITMAMQGAAKAFAEKLESLLYFPADKLFTPGSEANDGLRKAWGGFRNLGIGIIVIAGLVMVASQALGLELLDAYTIRKLMPRLLIALIGVALSWPLMNFLVSFFNDIGTFTYGLITQPFSSMPLINQGADTKAANVLLTIGGAGFLAYLYVIGFIASLSLLGSILLALFIAFFVLAIRWVAIAACIVLAPLAIASYVLPGTQKLWGFWKNTFLSTLIMFPILMALIASGDAMARIATALDGTNAFFIYIMYFAPFFLFSTAFKLAGGVIGGISQLANDKAGGVFSGLKNFRKGSAKRHWDEFATGRRGGEKNIIGKAAAYSRAAQDPGVGLRGLWSRKDRRTARNKLAEDYSNQAVKNNSLAWTADDAATAAAQHASSATKSGFTKNYIKEAQARGSNDPESELTRRASEQFSLLQTGVGARMGSRQMFTAAHKALQLSKTGYADTREGLDKRLTDSRDMVSRGLLTVNEAAGIQKMSQRLEASSASYSDWIKAIQGGQYHTDASTGVTTWQTIDSTGSADLNFADFILSSTVDNMTPGSLPAARKESMELISKHLNKQLQEAKAAATAPGATDEDFKKLGRITGTVANFHDTINSNAQHLAGTFGDEVSSQDFGAFYVIERFVSGTDKVGQPIYDQRVVSKKLNVRQFEDAVRQGVLAGPAASKVQAAFLDVRKEWSASDLAANGGVPPGPPGGGAPTPGGTGSGPGP